MDNIELIKLAHMGDKEARDTLVFENTGLIWSIVRRFTGRGYDDCNLYGRRRGENEGVFDAVK